MRRVPAVVVAATAFAAGVAAGLGVGVRATVGAAAGLAVGAALASVVLGRRAPRWASVGAVAAVAAGGVAHGAAARVAAENGCAARWPAETRLSLGGWLEAGHRPGWTDRARLPLRLDPARSAGCRGRVLVRLPRGMPPLPAGTAVALEGVWIPWPPPSGWALRPPEHRGWVRAQRVRVLGASAYGPPDLRARARAEALLARLFPRDFPLVDALLLGRREALDPSVEERYLASGLVHLLAISGSHVALLAAALLLVSAALRLPRRAGAVATLAVLAGYLVLIGAPASAVRAALMVGLGLVAWLRQRPVMPSGVVATAALLLLAANPWAVADVGAQLSFAGAIGLAAGARAVRGLPEPWRHGARRTLAQAVGGSAGAVFFTTPLVALHFGRVNPWAVVANLPAVPLAGWALVGVTLAAAVGAVWPVAGGLLADGATVPLQLLDRWAAWAARWPGAVWMPSHAEAVALAVGAILALGVLRARALGRPAVRVGAALGLVAALVVAAPALAPAPRALELHMLDVGQGDAYALRVPNGAWLLVDAGPRVRAWDAGAARVVPFLRRAGARRLALLVLTHADADHLGGAASVLRALPTDQVAEPGWPAPTPLYRALLDTIARRGIPWQPARAGDRWRLGEVVVEVLWPTDSAVRAARAANEASVVLRVVYGRGAVLLPGDAPQTVEEALVARYGPGLRATVLAAGHHGSATSTGDAWLAAVRPQLVLVSVGRGNRYGHPSPAVLRRLAARRLPLARTDRDGTVSLRIDPDGRWRRLP